MEVTKPKASQASNVSPIREIPPDNPQEPKNPNLRTQEPETYNPGPKEPKKSNHSPKEPKKSNPSPKEPTKSNPSPKKAKKSNPSPKEPKKSNPSPKEPTKSNPRPKEPMKSNPSSHVKKKADVSPKTPTKSNFSRHDTKKANLSPHYAKKRTISPRDPMKTAINPQDIENSNLSPQTPTNPISSPPQDSENPTSGPQNIENHIIGLQDPTISNLDHQDPEIPNFTIPNLGPQDTKNSILNPQDSMKPSPSPQDRKKSNIRPRDKNRKQMDKHTFDAILTYDRKKGTRPVFLESSVSETDSTTGKDGSHRAHRIRRMLVSFSEKTSINGVLFIKDTKYLPVRILWSILFILATAVMILQLVKLVMTFTSFKTHTKIRLSISNLKFPAVTICNTNAIRQSEVGRASPKVLNIVNNMRLENLLEDVEKWIPRFQNYTQEMSSFGDQGGQRKISVRKRDGGFFDDTNITWYDENERPKFIFQTISSDPLECEAAEATFNKVEKDLTHYFCLENETNRFYMGHQIEEMIVSCSYKGKVCYQSEFTHIPSSVFGNCYTLDKVEFITMLGGQRHGLNVIVFLETNEYTTGITKSKGIRVVIHEPNTIPFPDDEGITASAGTNTFVRLRQVDLIRKGTPYGECKLARTHVEVEFGKRYTKRSCQKLCFHKWIIQLCDCFDGANLALNAMINITGTLSVCSTDNQLNCLYNQEWNFDPHSCHCPNPCHEAQYRPAVSSLPWPNVQMAKYLAAAMCKQDPNVCDFLNNKTEKDLRFEFVKLTIFYEDLNHEIKEEEPNYKNYVFVSDIGGSVGLWIGMSVLSIFELFHFILAINHHFICG